ncbi:hypothetical protein IT398_01560 [Candidatus Nomurabacteria bacterium]|nr:hypothetical protein [Candidatus Nomurabacteria bacterium]
MAKIFIAGTRKLKWKNLSLLERAFALAQKAQPELVLDLNNWPYEEFLQKIAEAYAVILVSLGDISPNLVLDALRLGKPVILTTETGLRQRLGESVIWVNPEDEKDISQKIIWLSDPENYQHSCQRAKMFDLKHSWSDIADEFLDLAKGL